MLCREKHSITSSRTNKRLKQEILFLKIICFFLLGLMVRVKITAQLTILVLRSFDRAQRAYHLFCTHLNHHWSTIAHAHMQNQYCTILQSQPSSKKICLTTRLTNVAVIKFAVHARKEVFRAGHYNCLQSAVSHTLQLITGTNGRRLPEGSHCVIHFAD